MAKYIIVCDSSNHPEGRAAIEHSIFYGRKGLKKDDMFYGTKELAESDLKELIKDNPDYGIVEMLE